MAGLLRRRHQHKEEWAAEREREQQATAARAAKTAKTVKAAKTGQAGKDREEATGEVYKPAAEQHVLGWGHRET
ncbi:hypothetical protein AB0K09_31725 [Streptomyces sp. NPDC049577]|uniref:hypothetical protein n=1 Tax=Streptomyces sp. NPDC049577 TaxID=3155153 RepID=UPI0034430496